MKKFVFISFVFLFFLLVLFCSQNISKEKNFFNEKINNNIETTSYKLFNVPQTKILNRFLSKKQLKQNTYPHFFLQEIKNIKFPKYLKIFWNIFVYKKFCEINFYLTPRAP